LHVEALGADALWLRREAAAPLLAVVRLRGAGPVTLPAEAVAAFQWETILSTEDPAFVPGGRRPEVRQEEGALGLSFERPGAMIFRGAGR
jgi:hypothetical protein